MYNKSETKIPVDKVQFWIFDVFSAIVAVRKIQWKWHDDDDDDGIIAPNIMSNLKNYGEGGRGVPVI